LEESQEVKNQVRELLWGQKLAVLATNNKGQPYTTLVAFAAENSLKRLFFATTRSTRKYANIKADSRVAMLVDNRSNRHSDIHSASALTAIGAVEELLSDDRESSLNIYLAKHPHLSDFVTAPTCAFLSMDVKTYFFVSRFQRVFELHVTE
jgi:general stress protein 26